MAGEFQNRDQDLILIIVTWQILLGEVSESSMNHQDLYNDL